MGLSMNSRERVLTTLNRSQPDKVPIDFGGNNTGIHIIAYKNLLEYLGIEDKNIRFHNFVGQSIHPCEEVLERFEIDTRWLHPDNDFVSEKYIPEVNGKYRGVYDAFGVLWGDDAEKPVEDILYYSPCIHPFAEFTTAQEVREYDWPNGAKKGSLKNLRERAKQFRESTPYAIGTRPLGILWDYVTWIFGFTKAMRHLRRNPDMIVATLEALSDYWIDYFTVFMKEVKFGDEYYVDFIECLGDLGQQSGPIMNPDTTYVSVIKPTQMSFVKRLKEIAEVKTVFHCCGSVARFIPHIAEIGYDAINPVQIRAHDMEPCSLKERFGSMMTFWGGLCDTQNTLPFGTPGKIREEVRRNFECFKPGGGYVAANIHNITAEVPPENIVAMFDAAREFRKYQ